MNDPTRDLANDFVGHILEVLDQIGDTRITESLQTNYDHLRSAIHEAVSLYLETVSSERVPQIDVNRMTDLVIEKLKARFLREKIAA